MIKSYEFSVNTRMYDSKFGRFLSILVSLAPLLAYVILPLISPWLILWVMFSYNAFWLSGIDIENIKNNIKEMKNFLVLLGMLLLGSCIQQQPTQGMVFDTKPTVDNYTAPKNERQFKSVEEFQKFMNSNDATVRPTEKIKRIKVEFNSPMTVTTGELDPWGNSPRLNQEKEEVDPEFHEALKKAHRANRKVCLEALNQ